MTIWLKNGHLYGDSLSFSELDSQGLRWDNLAHNPEGLQACGYTEAPPYPHYDQATQIPQWNNGMGEWILVNKPAPPPALLPTRTYKVSHKEFLDLMTFQEMVNLQYLRKTVAAMTPAQYSDPTALPYQMLSVILDQFDNSTFIELNHPQTIAAFNQVLVPIGAFAPQRAARILDNQKPL